MDNWGLGRKKFEIERPVHVKASFKAQGVQWEVMSKIPPTNAFISPHMYF